MKEYIKDRDLVYRAVYLCFCILKNTTPDSAFFANINFDLLYEFCELHSIAALAYEGIKSLQKSGIDIPNSLKFKNAKEQSMIKNLTMDMEREELFLYMEEKGIWYAPLKGIFLQKLYPGMGLRQMCDNDILYDDVYKNDVREWFLNRGYEMYLIDRKDDQYIKLPFASFEMHVTLFNNWEESASMIYFKNIKEKLIKDEENLYGYHQSPEDFYLYMIAHAYKHYLRRGIGVRFLFDMYVFLNHYTLDWNYVNVELDQLQLRNFENTCRNILNKISNADSPEFSIQLSEEELKDLDYFLSSGTYGIIEHGIDNRLSKEGLGKYILQRCFPNKEMLDYYPQIAKSKMPLPIKWIWRAGIIIGTKPQNVLREIRALIKLRRNR